MQDSPDPPVARQLHYEDAGTGTPVVLLHGNMCDGSMWDEQFTELAQFYRTIRYDFRGFGRSPGPAGPTGNFDDFVALMDRLSIDRAHLVGLSLGAAFALSFASAHPTRVRSIVVASAGIPSDKPDPEGEEFGRQFGRILEAAAAGDRRRAAELVMKLRPMQSAARLPDVAERLLRLLEDNMSALFVSFDSPEFGPPSIERARSIRCPVLIIQGALEMPSWLQQGEALQQAIAGSDRVVVKNAGHMVNMEQPERFTATVLRFLQRADADGRN